MSITLGRSGLAHSRIWHLVDVKGLILGRICTSIAQTLMGKHKPFYCQSSDVGDYVVVINAKYVELPHNLDSVKVYKSHSGYPGGLKTVSFKSMMQKDPTFVIRKCVKGMLPKNNLIFPRMKRLLVFKDENHPYSQNIVKHYDDKYNELIHV